MATENIVWHNSSIGIKERERLNGHQGACIWLTGLSGSGKSTIANVLDQQLFKFGVHSYLLDGDNIRHGLNNDLDFSEAGRKENIRRISEVSKLFVDAGIIVITAFISPFRVEREFARTIIPKGKFFEIYVDASIEICKQRDPKGLYKRAAAGEIPNFTGIDSPYEIPVSPELILRNGEGSSIQENVGSILTMLTEYNVIRS